MSSGLPENCIRGIYTDAFTPEGPISLHVFNFQNPGRTDDWLEASINWEDDADAIQFTLDQERVAGQKQFHGAVLLARVAIDTLRDKLDAGDVLAYERQTKPDNPYHGNILLKAHVSKPFMTMVKAGLAMACTPI